MNIKICTETSQTTTIELTGNLIVSLLKQRYPEYFNDSSKTEVTFQVPSGGDYSNTKLEIDSENVVTVKILTVSGE